MGTLRVASQPVRLLLPPSEAKTCGGRGRPLRQRAQDGPLGDARARTLGALRRLMDGSAADAAEALLLPAGVAEEALAANAAVLDSPTTPALRRYSGVVYDGLGYSSLSPAAQRLAARRAIVFSGLFGAVRGDEPVPLYRVPAKAVLPGCGIAATFWRPVLEDVMPSLLGNGIAVDLRSSDYAAMWRPRGEFAERVVSVRVLSPVPRGGYGIVSYTSKLAKGRLAAALVERVARGGRVASAGHVADAWYECGGVRVDETAPGRLDLYSS